MANVDQQRSYSPRVRRKRRQARDEILAVAEAILDAEGIECVTLAAVAERLGMTKQALYHYYPSKEALVRVLVIRLLDAETRHLRSVVETTEQRDHLLGALIDAFHRLYSERLHAFRAVYCQTQLFSTATDQLDERTLREEIHPRTGQLFDLLEQRLASEGDDTETSARHRQLAFSAWLSALGLMTMKSIAEASRDPLRHADQALVDTLTRVFDAATDP